MRSFLPGCKVLTPGLSLRSVLTPTPYFSATSESVSPERTLCVTICRARDGEPLRLRLPLLRLRLRPTARL